MKFVAEFVIPAHSKPQDIGGEAIGTLASGAEAAGFDAICFNEHPAPSRKWLGAGGHDAFDPFAVLSFCAALTTRIRLLSYLLVLPYRNPFLIAKGIASVDVLSGGRVIAGLGLGYLRSEFAALGVDFEERNALFDEAAETLIALWTQEAVSRQGRHWSARDQVSTPRPLQSPHPPIWIGGNSRVARERVARYGQGWAPLQANEVISRTTRTPAMATQGQLIEALADLRRLLEQRGRDPRAVDVLVAWREGRGHMAADLNANAHLDLLGRLEQMGVTHYDVSFGVQPGAQTPELVERYGAEIIRPSH